MTNFEKYKDRILELITESNSTPVLKDGKIVACRCISCEECDFNGGNCRENQFNWLYEDDGEKQSNCLGCKYMYNEVCCNGFSEHCSYGLREEDCKGCELFEKEDGVIEE